MSECSKHGGLGLAGERAVVKYKNQARKKLWIDLYHGSINFTAQLRIKADESKSI
jgi:hypothetical protein